MHRRICPWTARASSTSIALAALAVREPVAEVVDVAERLALLSFDEDFELLQEVGAVGCLVAGEDLKDTAGSVRQEEEALVILGVGDPGHDHREEVGVLRRVVEQDTWELADLGATLAVHGRRVHLQERDLREADLVGVALLDLAHRLAPGVLVGLDEQPQQAEVVGQDDVLAEVLERVDQPLVGGEERFPIERARRVVDHHDPLRWIATGHLLVLQLPQEVEQRQRGPLAVAEVGAWLVPAAAGVRLAVRRDGHAEVVLAVDAGEIAGQGVGHVLGGELRLTHFVEPSLRQVRGLLGRLTLGSQFFGLFLEPSEGLTLRTRPGGQGRSASARSVTSA